MKLAIFRRTDDRESRGDPADGIVLGMLRAMVRREPATPVIASIPGGAVGAWLEDGDPPGVVLAYSNDGSFAIGDPLLLEPCDAAALLEAVRVHGTDAFSALDGSFAAVVHDAPARRTFVLTDRFSTRPLYAAEGGSFFACASEAKALFAIPGLEPREDPLARYDIMNFGFMAGERTWFAGVRYLQDSRALVLEPRRRPVEFRYRSRLFVPGALSEEEGLDAIAVAFEEGVRALARRARRPALLLSGGLDSRTISSFCARAGVDLVCHTCGPARSRETRSAHGIARALRYPIERFEAPWDLPLRRAVTASWIGDGHVSSGDIHFIDHHIERLGPAHDAFFDGWLGGVIGGGIYVSEPDLALEGKGALADAMLRFFDYRHPAPLEDRLYATEFAARLRERARESIDEFLSDWDVPTGFLASAKEAACLRFRDRRWQLFHNGIAAEPFCRGLRPYVLGGIVERMQALPTGARLHARFYQKLIARHFPEVARVRWEKTGRAIGKPESAAIERTRQLRRKAFYYLSRLTMGRLNLRDHTRYYHYDRDFREHPELRDWFRALLDTGHEERSHLRPGGIRALVEAEARGGRYFQMISRLADIEIARRLFFDRAAEHLLPEKIGSVRLRGGDAPAPLRLRDAVPRTTISPRDPGRAAA